MLTNTQPRISEDQIASLVETFYGKVQRDPEIGPVFNEAISDWPSHIALLKNFWSTVLLTTGRYKGDPMMTHLQLPIEHKHFDRWLHLFEETAVQVLPPHLATLVVASPSHRRQLQTWHRPATRKIRSPPRLLNQFIEL